MNNSPKKILKSPQHAKEVENGKSQLLLKMKITIPQKLERKLKVKMMKVKQQMKMKKKMTTTTKKKKKLMKKMTMTEKLRGREEKRGRKKKPKVQLYGDDVFDDEGNPIENDEVVIPQEDPKGKEKIDELGYLQGDRKFRMKTFKLLGKGDRLYMISTEPARLVGFRDSYLLFKTHRTLFKK